MNHQDIIAHLRQLYPPEDIFTITTENVLSELVRRLGKEALELSAEELELAREEVRAAIEHHLDERDLISIGLDACDIVRNL